MERYDVVVIGAGLAGLTCAERLARGGAGVLLADSKCDLSRGIHTTGIFVRRTLEDFALPEEHLGPPVHHVTLYSPALRPLELASDAPEFRVGDMAAIYSHFLDRAVRAGVEWAPGARFAAALPASGGSSLHLECQGITRRVRARLVIGADGARSRVADHLGLGRNRRWIVGAEEVYHGLPLEGEPRFHCFLNRQLAPGYLAWLVNDGREVHVGVGGYTSRFDPAGALRQFKASLAHVPDLSYLAERLPRAEPAERRGGLIPVGGLVSPLANERGLLVGDAAGAVSPLTAGGLDPCLRLSVFASDCALRYLRGDPSALSAYAVGQFRAKFRTRRWMRGAMALMNGPALDAACWLLRRPAFQPLAENIFFGRGSFPDVTQLLPAAHPPAA